MAKNETNKTVAQNMLGNLAATYSKKQTEPAEKKNDELKEEKTENNIVKTENENRDFIYKTKNYEIFKPYPKAELRLELHTGQQREQLKNSIEAHGITSPIKVSPIENDKFVVLSGHNRLDIAKELKIEVPYIVLKDLSEDVKDEIVAEEHILNRQQSDFKPSQMMKLLIAIRKTSNNQKELLERTSMSKTGTYRYLSLEKLLPELLYGWVDTQRLSLMSAEALSKSASNEKQKEFYEFITTQDIKVIQEKPMKKLLELKEDDWNEEKFIELFCSVKKEVHKNIKIEIPEEILKSTLTKDELAHSSEIIVKLLEEYKRGNITL